MYNTENPIFIIIITIISENQYEIISIYSSSRSITSLWFKSTYFKWIACVCLHFIKFMIQFGRWCRALNVWTQAPLNRVHYQTRFETHIDEWHINKFSIKRIVTLSTIEKLVVLFARYTIHRLLADIAISVEGLQHII